MLRSFNKLHIPLGDRSLSTLVSWLLQPTGVWPTRFTTV